MKAVRSLWLLLSSLVFLIIPSLASAHEVYVLTTAEISQDVHAAPFDMMAVMMNDFTHFAFWAFIAILVVVAVFLIGTARWVERSCNPFFARLRVYAAPIARITVGISFIAAAYYQASYGPELPLLAAYGPFAGAITIVLVAIGVLITFGFYVRMAAFIALLLFGYAVYRNGFYMLTYTNYLGEILTLLILGLHHGTAPRSAEAVARARRHLFGLANYVEPIAKKLAPYSFLLLRVCFGTSLLYASLYAKILHNNLALQVATLPLAGHMFGIAHYLGFEPHFLVLGAAIIEIVIAVFFILGLEIRFTSLFLLFWLSCSLLYFGEVVWPHIILIGIPIAFICYGYDKYSLEGRFFKKGAREPVL